MIDNLIPSVENPHEINAKADLNVLKDVHTLSSEEGGDTPPLQAGQPGECHVHNHKLHRMGMFTALAIAIHNFPEGLTTFLAALEDPQVGVAIAVAHQSGLWEGA